MVTPTLSVAVKVEGAVPPEATETVPGLKLTTGLDVSGGGAVIVTVSVAVVVFPAASPTVAVHVLVESVVTVGAVNVLPLNVPSVHDVEELVTPTLSELVSVDVPVPPEATVRVVGLKLAVGAVVSGGGGGGGGGGGLTVVPPLPPPPHATVETATSGKIATVRRNFFILSHASKEKFQLGFNRKIARGYPCLSIYTYIQEY